MPKGTFIVAITPTKSTWAIIHNVLIQKEKPLILFPAKQSTIYLLTSQNGVY